VSLLWLRLAILLYGVAALAVLPAALYERPRWLKIAVPAAVGGLFFHVVSLAEMLNAAHHALPVETHETQSLLSLLFALAFVLVYWAFRTYALGIFLLPLAVILGLLPAFRPGLEGSLNPADVPGLHSGWLFLHIALLLAAYAALLVSLVASVLYLVQERRLKAKSLGADGLRLPPLDTLDRIALRSLLFGLPSMTAGLLIGTFLAEVTYGPSYFRDPKILLAFAMWLAYVIMIAIRRHSGLRGRRAVYLAGSVFLVILTVWASNQFSVVHRFPAP
jgi:ABC-type uncharacterized transport system permease subunit